MDARTKDEAKAAFDRKAGEFVREMMPRGQPYPLCDDCQFYGTDKEGDHYCEASGAFDACEIVSNTASLYGLVLPEEGSDANSSPAE